MNNMQPNQLQPTPNDIARLNKKKLVWGLICIIGPSALLVVSILSYVATRLMISPGDIEVVDASIGRAIVNIILYLVGVVATLTWLPGLIVGIILLATRRTNA